MRTRRPKAELMVTADERQTLEQWTRRPKTAQALARHARIVLACATGTPNHTVAVESKTLDVGSGLTIDLFSNVSHSQPMTDAYNLHRFLTAQAHAYDTGLSELRAGRKSSHWIWFIFPQIAGLGHSAMAQQFAIASLDEAKTYLQHPTLGPRLRACTQLVLDVAGRSAEEIFGYPDNLKFRSCMTLFRTAATDNAVFKDALLKYSADKPDQLTMSVLARHNMPRC